MCRNAGAALAAAFVLAFSALSGCAEKSSSSHETEETAVRNDLTQAEATRGVDGYAEQIGTRLPPGARLAARGTGTVNCHTPGGDQRTGQVLVSARYLVEGVDAAAHEDLIDLLRDTWTSLDYRLIDDIHYDDGDRTVRVATSGDDYHLTVYSYGDNRSVPLVLVESPCVWPDPPTSRPVRTRPS